MNSFEDAGLNIQGIMLKMLANEGTSQIMQ